MLSCPGRVTGGNIEERRVEMSKIYNSVLYADVYKREKLPQYLENQIEFVEEQIDDGEKEIEITICGITIILDYDKDEIALYV